MNPKENPPCANTAGDFETPNKTQQKQSSTHHDAWRVLRPAPAYQCYASDLIAEENYMLATFQERGFLWTLHNYCWANGSIPADRTQMARLLGCDAKDVAAAYGTLVQKHVEPIPGKPDRLHIPELERQRQEKARWRKSLADGGRRGGLQTQAGKRRPSLASSQAKAPEMRGDEMKGKEVIQGKASGNEEWISQYEGRPSRKRAG